jgi:hypothetical protein
MRDGRVTKSSGRGAEGSWRRSARGGRAGGGGGEVGLWPRRAERLDDTSASFFVFFSQDDIFMVCALEDLAVLSAGATPARASL